MRMMNNQPRIEIIIEGGALQEIFCSNLSESIQIQLKDYDIQDIYHPHIDFDDNNIPFVTQTWNSDDMKPLTHQNTPSLQSHI